MKNIEMQWKEFNVSVELITAQAKILAPGKILGASANSCLQLHCDDSISSEEVEAIEAYLSELTDESEEATSYKSSDDLRQEQAEVDAAVLVLKEDAINKTWNQLTGLQRKILLGLKVTKADLDAQPTE